MATKSYLTEDDLREAAPKLKPPKSVPDGDEKKVNDFVNQREFSDWLGQRLFARLKVHSEWEAAGPIAIGSWARGELSPKSDIDLIFCGDEEATASLVRDFTKQGLKIRARVPADSTDWTVGVEPFDVLALYSAKALTTPGSTKLALQKARLEATIENFRGSLISAMLEDRRARSERYDSISNYLEPNLKYGPGGLRDLDQALNVVKLFPERFGKAEHAIDVLRYYKAFFLLVRQKLHLGEGVSDILLATEQKSISDWLGFREVRDFMREIQKGVSRVSFYADWVFEQATASEERLREVEEFEFNTVESLFLALDKDASVLMQNRVRLAADTLFAADRGASDRQVGSWLGKFLEPSSEEASLVGLFRARLIDHCVPEFRKIVGYVQHDQYHRFTVDAHILQALRELKRLCRDHSVAGEMAGTLATLTPTEWQILSLACLYHDIAKGRAGDHAVEGIDIARSDLARFGVDPMVVNEVAWIVEEHLALSQAAFRGNAKSPETWASLARQGVIGRRIALLSAFTVVDIRATNPEAWTQWKARLLFELVRQLEQPETNAMVAFAEALLTSSLPRCRETTCKWLEVVDPFVVGALPLDVLIEDLEHAAAAAIDLSPRVVAVERGAQTWIRFHSKKDKPGLFLKFAKALSTHGLRVRHASIVTDHDLGVYDWFEVSTVKPADQITKLLHHALDKDYEIQAPSPCFDSIKVVFSDANEWVISFRGRDQRDALLKAAFVLFTEGVSVRWAKVHTWGLQIDDVFGVRPTSHLQQGELLRLIKLKLERPA